KTTVAFWSIAAPPPPRTWSPQHPPTGPTAASAPCHEENHHRRRTARRKARRENLDRWSDRRRQDLTAAHAQLYDDALRRHRSWRSRCAGFARRHHPCRRLGCRSRYRLSHWRSEPILSGELLLLICALCSLWRRA